MVLLRQPAQAIGRMEFSRGTRRSMVAPHVRAGRLRYVLESFEVEPWPVTFVYPQARLLSPTVRAFADLCTERLRRLRFD